MRESVYDLLNDMDHQPKEYTAENVSEKDIKKWKNMPLLRQSSAPSRQGL